MFCLCVCVHVCMPVTVRAHPAAVCRKEIKGVFFHFIATTAVSPQGAADSAGTPLLSFRHNWAAGEKDCSCCSLCAHCKMQLELCETYNLCICCSRSAGDKLVLKMLRNHNDASAVLCSCPSRVSLNPRYFQYITQWLFNVYFISHTTLKDPWRPPGHKWHTLKLYIWPEYSSTVVRHQSWIEVCQLFLTFEKCRQITSGVNGAVTLPSQRIHFSSSQLLLAGSSFICSTLILLSLQISATSQMVNKNVFLVQKRKNQNTETISPFLWIVHRAHWAQRFS